MTIEQCEATVAKGLQDPTTLGIAAMHFCYHEPFDAYVYFIQNRDNGNVMIGHTTNLLVCRKALVDGLKASGFSGRVDLLYHYKVSSRFAAEAVTMFHDEYEEKAVGGGWFKISKKDIQEMDDWVCGFRRNRLYPHTFDVKDHVMHWLTHPEESEEFMDEDIPPQVRRKIQLIAQYKRILSVYEWEKEIGLEKLLADAKAEPDEQYEQCHMLATQQAIDEGLMENGCILYKQDNGKPYVVKYSVITAKGRRVILEDILNE